MTPTELLLSLRAAEYTQQDTHDTSQPRPLIG